MHHKLAVFTHTSEDYADQAVSYPFPAQSTPAGLGYYLVTITQLLAVATFLGGFHR